MFHYFSDLIGRPIDPYKVKPEHTPLTEGQAKLPHVAQLPDNTSTEPKGQHE